MHQDRKNIFAKSYLSVKNWFNGKLQIPQHKLFTQILHTPNLYRLAHYKKADNCGGIHIDPVS